MRALYKLSRDKAKVLATGKPTEFFEQMYERGFVGAEWSGQLLDLVDEATSSVRSESARKIGRGINKFNRMAMAPFSMSEFLNRALAFDMGRSAAADLISAVQKGGKGVTANEAAALNFFKELPDAYRKRIAKSMRGISQASVSDDTREAIEDSIIKHLIGKTIFNYDKASASQISREVTPVLMTFLKFPLNVMGDAADTMARKGVWKGGQDIGRRFLAPHMAIAAMDTILTSLSDSERLSLEQALEGDDPIGSLRFFASGGSRAGLLRYSIAGSIGGMLTGQWASPPALAPVRIAGEALTGDWKEAKKAAKDSYKFMFPAPLTNMLSLYDSLANAGIAPPILED
jgi:hypothetical protein